MAAMVELIGVHKSFGSLHVLRGVDLRVRQGEVTVVLGPSAPRAPASRPCCARSTTWRRWSAAR